MNYTKILSLLFFICFSFSCSIDLHPIPAGLAGEGSAGGTHAALNLQVMSMASYQTAMNPTISGLCASSQ